MATESYDARVERERKARCAVLFAKIASGDFTSAEGEEFNRLTAEQVRADARAMAHRLAQSEWIGKRLAAKQPVPTIVWNDEDMAGHEDGTHDVIYEILADEDVNGRWEDFGIGQYEYAGAVGYDSRPGVAADCQDVLICFKGAAGKAVVLPKGIKVGFSGGGCDGEHSGRCREACSEWEAEIEWKPVHVETRGEDVYVVFEGEQV